ncbi:oxygenase MpaB family protein [Lentzea cavernae]|nr:oxygenase MpaB family protein [Lentzea cavernae]
MGIRYRYIGLVHHDPRPFAVLRVHDSVEEIYAPERGWENADPRWRDWFMNVPLESGQALGLLHSLAPMELREDMDPYPHALGRDAADGFGTQWFYYAVETADHPLDDPASLVRLHYPSKSESWFTSDLMWAKVPVPGRRVRVSEEELRRLQEVLVRRAFGGAEVQHYAVVNPFYPDVDHPAAIVRVGPEGERRYVRDGEWEATSVVADVRHRYLHGRLVLLTEEAATRLAERWRPHPDSSRVRYFAWLTANGNATAVMRAWDVGGGIEEESYVDGLWTDRRMCVFDNEEGRVEVDQETAARLGAIHDAHEYGGSEDGRYDHYYAILEQEFGDVSTAHELVRTWGGSDGHSREQHFLTRINGWRSCMTVYEVWTDRNRNYAIPISEEVADELRKAWLADFAARAEGREPPPRRPLGTWAGFGKVTLTRVDDEVLDSLRQVGDPRADSAVAGIHDLGRVNELLTGLVRNGDEVPEGLPPLLRQYFAESVLPEWADRTVLARGQELWDEYGPHLAAALCCYALPVRYTMALQHTRHGLESTRLLRDVLADGGLTEPGGRGLRTVQKIRLRLAAARRQAGGTAANQVDLAVTLGTLSVHVTQGVRGMNVALPKRDGDDLFHIWSVVGHLLGVDPRLLPGTYDQAVTLLDRIGRRRGRTAVGVELAEELGRRVEAALPRELSGAFPYVVRGFCVHDRSIPDILRIDGLDLGRWLEYLAPITAVAGLPAGSITDDRVWRRTTSEVVGKALLEADRDEDLTLPGG